MGRHHSVQREERGVFLFTVLTNDPRTAFIPSSIQHLNSPFPAGPRDVDRMMSGSKYLLSTESDPARPRAQPFLAKRRRLLQQECQQQQQQQQQQEQWPGVRLSAGAGQGKLYPLNTSLDIPSRFSPPVSPKTIPEYDQHHFPTTPSSLPPPILRPCHICHRRPTTREVLDAYADCDLCGQRACYICLRECTAADCCGATRVTPDANTMNDDHLYDEQMTDQPYMYGDGIVRRKVCAWCAVEGMTDSGMEIVRCMDCVRGMTSSNVQPSGGGW